MYGKFKHLTATANFIERFFSLYWRTISKHLYFKYCVVDKKQTNAIHLFVIHIKKTVHEKQCFT